MILTTHAFVGAATATALTSNPVIGLGIGVATHWLSDVIPHWQYQLRSENPGDDKQKLIIGVHSIPDIAKVLLDVAIGLVPIMAMILFYTDIGFGVMLAPALWGALGGMVPDGAQFFYHGLQWRWLAGFQRIHDFFHAPRSISDPCVGLAAQGALLIAAAMVLRAAFGG